MAMQRMRDFSRFARNLESFTDGQVKLVEWDEDQLSSLSVQLQPNSGLYEGGRFEFLIEMCDDFPEVCPGVRCLTPIYHPNIDPTEDHETNVCVSLFDKWDPDFGLQDIVQCLLFLFYEPNLEDPSSPYFDSYPLQAKFEQHVADSLHGREVDGVPFPYNYNGHELDTNAEGEVESELGDAWLDEDGHRKQFKHCDDTDHIVEKVSHIMARSGEEEAPEDEVVFVVACDIIDEHESENNGSKDEIDEANNSTEATHPIEPASDINNSALSEGIHACSSEELAKRATNEIINNDVNNNSNTGTPAFVMQSSAKLNAEEDSADPTPAVPAVAVQTRPTRRSGDSVAYQVDRLKAYKCFNHAFSMIVTAFFSIYKKLRIVNRPET